MAFEIYLASPGMFKDIIDNTVTHVTASKKLQKEKLIFLFYILCHK
jgi:hypothetical protein